MSRKLSIIALVLSLIALCLSAVGIFLVSKPAAETVASETTTVEATPKDIQYVVFLGTNDKDTNEPVCTGDEAKALADEVLSKHFGGFTIQEANGGWVSDEGTVYHEYTLVILLSDTDADTVHKAADELIEAFHQSSVLIQANETTTEFYSGN